MVGMNEKKFVVMVVVVSVSGMFIECVVLISV